MIRSVLALLLGAMVVLTTPGSGAASGDDEVRRSGSCSASATWQLRAREGDDGRIEVRGEVDHTASGQTWTWQIKHDGSVSASGRATTSSGSFGVRRSLVDLAGVDRCVFRAVRVKTGEVCRGVIDW